MPILTLTAVPHTGSSWKLQINGLREDQFLVLHQINSEWEKNLVCGMITGKLKVSGTGMATKLPLSHITPLLNILEDWGYEIRFLNKAGSESSMSKMWTLIKKPETIPIE